MQQAADSSSSTTLTTDVLLSRSEPAHATARLGSRSLTEHMGGAPNAHRFWYAARRQDGWLLGPLRILRNYFVIHAMKHFPSFALKRAIFRSVLGMKLGRNVTISPGVVLDYFFPELTEMGDNTIVGLNAMIITHEFFHDRHRSGPVRIGDNVLIGANSTLLAGVSIGSHATVSAGSFVNRSVPEGALVRGNPCEIVRVLRPAEA
jgi:acetyltransferase-like isoleucine patch superfamily enzyme